ncbi:hypothetical protein V6R21_11940 [Limibacter armeniacum]|uniref:hypothetical protein n=1 Tax=Limibacter armeniacum TaxID=466084 RepID=UPI002FE5A70E
MKKLLFVSLILMSHSLLALDIKGEWFRFKEGEIEKITITEEVFRIATLDTNYSELSAKEFRIESVIKRKKENALLLFIRKEDRKTGFGCLRLLNINKGVSLEFGTHQVIYDKDMDVLIQKATKRALPKNGFLFFSNETIEGFKSKKSLSDLSKEEFMEFGETYCALIADRITDFDNSYSPLELMGNTFITVLFEMNYNPVYDNIFMEVDKVTEKYDASEAINFNRCGQ